MRTLIVTGAYPTGPGYPNVSSTLERLAASAEINVEFAGTDLGANRRLWREAKGGLPRKLLHIAILTCSNVRSVRTALRMARRLPNSFLYLPHPPLLALLVLSLLPKRVRPRCVADAYICVWDTVVRDRKLLKENGFAARLLRAIEVRTLACADFIVVDTLANEQMMVNQFGVRSSRVVSLPLAINEKIYQPSQYVPVAGRACRVLFVGTLVPLHGIERIIDALRDLEGVAGLEFMLIGDGQQSPLLDTYLSSKPALAIRWERQWMDEGQINQAIMDADICLGVFGGAGKASRVLPFKLYSYFRVGRAVVSQSAFGTPASTNEVPFLAIDGLAGVSLAAAIRYLAENPLERVEWAERGARYYRRHLGAESMLHGWTEMVDKMMERGDAH